MATVTALVNPVVGVGVAVTYRDESPDRIGGSLAKNLLITRFKYFAHWWTEQRQ